MKENKTYLLVLISILLCYCTKEDEGLSIKSDNEVNTWIYQEMKNNYLWLDEINEITYYDHTVSPDAFFMSLISEKEKKVKNNQAYCYSYIERKSSTTKVSDAPENTYGMEYVFYLFPNGSYYARILYVLPNSPAEIAGIRRGMWIKKIDGKPITKENRSSLANGNGIILDVYEGTQITKDENTKEIAIKNDALMYENPILKDTILIGNNGIKIGYLCYNQFKTGPNGFEDKTYNNQLKSVFANFKSNNIQEFILDLRYNPGGYLDCAVILGTYLIKQEALNKVFCQVTYNPKSKWRSKSYYCRDTVKYNLNLNRLYILTGEWTASASEAVINGLIPLMNIVQVGDTTEGKNLGSIEISDDKYNWIMHPIVAKIANSLGEGDYWNGIVPNSECIYEELRNVYPLGQLGTPDDYLIYLALSHMKVWDNKSLKSPEYRVKQLLDCPLNPQSSSITRKSIGSIRIN